MLRDLNQRLYDETSGGDVSGSGDVGGDPAAAPAAPTGDWRAALPPELRDNPTLNDVSDIATLAKRFVDTKAMVGASVRLPTTDAGKETIEEFTAKILENPNLGLMRKPDPENPEALADVYRALGRPDAPEGYSAPEGIDAEVFGALSQTAHELGLTKQQYEKLSAAHMQMVQEKIGSITQERDQGLAQLKGEWGGAFEEKAQRSLKLVKALGGHPQLEAAMAEGQVDAATLRLLDKVATQLGGEGTQLAQQLGQVTQATTDELRQRRDELTRRLMTESLTAAEQQSLQQKILSYSEQLVANSK